MAQTVIGWNFKEMKDKNLEGPEEQEEKGLKVLGRQNDWKMQNPEGPKKKDQMMKSWNDPGSLERKRDKNMKDPEVPEEKDEDTMVQEVNTNDNTLWIEKKMMNQI